MSTDLRSLPLLALAACAGLPVGPDDGVPIEAGPVGCIGPEADSVRAGCTRTMRTVNFGPWFVDEVDACGRIAGRVNAFRHGRRTFYMYETWGHLALEEHPDTGWVDIHTYGPGWRKESVDHYKNDELDWVETWSYDSPEALDPTQWVADYGKRTEAETYAYDDSGQLEWVELRTGDVVLTTTSYRYDLQGRLIGRQLDRSGTVADTVYEWSDDVLVRAVTEFTDWRSPETVEYRYDDLGRLVAEDEWNDRELYGGSARYAWVCDG